MTTVVIGAFSRKVMAVLTPLDPWKHDGPSKLYQIDSRGNKELAYALICSVYGIGKTTAFKICVDTALDPHKCLGSNQLKIFKRILEKGWSQ